MREGGDLNYRMGNPVFGCFSHNFGKVGVILIGAHERKFMDVLSMVKYSMGVLKLRTILHNEPSRHVLASELIFGV